MSQEIITLPKQLANQIAAGEVVERPVSVVKELVENSIDARASHIDIRLEEWGIQFIEVKDNGAGIPAGSLQKALEKYSTSKIRSLEDLHEVMTFGFRGEALASISSVSEFTLSSNDGTSTAGRGIYTDGWDTFTESDIPHERGTTIQVKNLFHNTPARLNYLKKPRTEYLKIVDIVQKFALAYPKIVFSLKHDDKTSLLFPKNQTGEERIYEIYGREFAENLLKISHEFGGVTISWYVSDPKVSFPNKNKQVMYVNKRVITSPMIAKAISDAYNRFIPHGSFPAYVLFVDLDPTQVDVNVHPRKMEVRFAGESNIFRSVYHGIKNELERVSLVSAESVPSENPHSWILSPLGEREAANHVPLSSEGEGLGVREKYYTGSGTKFKSYSPYKNTSAHPAQAAIEFSKVIVWEKHQDISDTQNLTRDIYETPLGRIVWQVHNSYIVVQTQEGLTILDQHALAERVIYERLANTSYIPKSQQILWGIGMHLDVTQQENFENFQEAFSAMWFEIDILSNGNIMIHSVPDFMKKENIQKVFAKILEDISEVGSRWLDEVRHKIWAYTACRSAVKFGDKLSVFEMQKLLSDASLDYSATCPHGRPVVYDVSLEDLQKKYER